MSTSFAELGLPPKLVQSLRSNNITETFPIQEATIPAGLNGKDVCGKAPTGSGKTFAFGIPTVINVGRARARQPQALVLAPTRELAEQIKKDLAPLAHSMDRRVLAVYGGTSYGPQKGALNKGVEILVATPGRLEDLLEQGSVRLDHVNIVVVDEADRMADMGFLPVVKRILDQTSPKRQTMLFSATLDGDVGVLIKKYQNNPVRYEAESQKEDPVVKHHFWLVDRQDRIRHTAEVVEKMGRSIVFTRTRHGADRLARQLGREGVDAVAMHGGRSQAQRQRALRSFSNGKIHALVATDVAARGIHVDSVEVVVHFDPAAETKDFVHRSGRTGRAGAEGTVVSLVSHDQKGSVSRMLRPLGLDGQFTSPRADRLIQTRFDVEHKARPEHRLKAGLKTETVVEAHLAIDDDNVDIGEQSLFVGNLPWSTTADDLDRMFSKVGRVSGAAIATKRGRSKGYGFVEMPSSAADRAIRQLDRSKLNGRQIQVRAARPGRSDRP